MENKKIFPQRSTPRTGIKDDFETHDFLHVKLIYLYHQKFIKIPLILKFRTLELLTWVELCYNTPDSTQLRQTEIFLAISETKSRQDRQAVHTYVKLEKTINRFRNNSK